MRTRGCSFSYLKNRNPIRFARFPPYLLFPVHLPLDQMQFLRFLPLTLFSVTSWFASWQPLLLPHIADICGEKIMDQVEGQFPAPRRRLGNRWSAIDLHVLADVLIPKKSVINLLPCFEITQKNKGRLIYCSCWFPSFPVLLHISHGWNSHREMDGQICNSHRRLLM